MSETRTLTVTLPEHLLRLIERSVRSGEFGSESEVVQAGLEAMQAEHQPDDAWLRAEALPVEAACRADPGRLVPSDDVGQRLEQRFQRDMAALGRPA